MDLDQQIKQMRNQSQQHRHSTKQGLANKTRSYNTAKQWDALQEEKRVFISKHSLVDEAAVRRFLLRHRIHRAIVENTFGNWYIRISPKTKALWETLSKEAKEFSPPGKKTILRYTLRWWQCWFRSIIFIKHNP